MWLGRQFETLAERSRAGQRCALDESDQNRAVQGELVFPKIEQSAAPLPTRTIAA